MTAYSCHIQPQEQTAAFRTRTQGKCKNLEFTPASMLVLQLSGPLTPEANPVPGKPSIGSPWFAYL